MIFNILMCYDSQEEEKEGKHTSRKIIVKV